MIKSNSAKLTIFSALAEKVRLYAVLTKHRLSMTVVFSSVIGYLLATGGVFIWVDILALFIGGFAVTGAANALNQLFEKDLDKLMTRTENRPIPQGKISQTEAALAAGVMASIGIISLWYFFNPKTALLAAVSLLIYSFVYTPLKRISPIAVFVGAIPGALPPLIGFAAVQNGLSQEAMIVFTIQFLWQFPHFWSIAWIGHDQYTKAGFKLLPSEEGRTKSDALQSLVFTIVMVGASILPLTQGFVGWYGGVVIILAGLYIIGIAVKLYRECTIKSAKRLMFASIIYLPLVQLALVLNQI